MLSFTIPLLLDLWALLILFHSPGLSTEIALPPSEAFPLEAGIPRSGAPWATILMFKDLYPLPETHHLHWALLFFF